MKEKFIKSTIILIIGGFITKVLGMLIRIISTRIIGLEGIGLYMLVLPTFNLFITIATLSFPVAISKIVAEDKRNNKKIVFGIIPVALVFNFILIILLLIFSPYIANNLLKNSDLYFPILAIAITLPFITLSSIIRGYFFGKEKMIPHVVSNIFEQIIRIIIILIITPLLLQKGIIFAVCGLIIFNCISELASIIVLFFFLPKKIKIKKSDIKPDLSYIKDIFFISIPTTLGRLISSIGMFLEPIVITSILLKIGWNTTNITTEFGIITGYVLPMVMMPSFLSGAISSALLPVITKLYIKKSYKEVKRKTRQAIIYSLLIGIPCSLFMFFFPEFCLTTIFHTIHGSEYLKLASLIFIVSYILGPLSTCLQAIDKPKIVMKSNLIGVIIKILVLSICLFLRLNFYSILIAYLIQYIFILIYQIFIIKKIIN